MKEAVVLRDVAGFADIDLHFAKFIAGFGGGETAALAAALLSRNVRLGHTCLDLTRVPDDADLAHLRGAGLSLEKWRTALEKNRAVGKPDNQLPLVLDGGGRLYLRRYWNYEQSLASAILRRCDAQSETGAAGTDPQQAAVETALQRRFVVISGGPGTGKTTTVFKILQHLVKSNAGDPLRIALAAPTGKAAARLQEAFSAACGDEAIRDSLPESASTLHRLLGPRRGSVYFRHNQKNPLPFDLVVVDEASMVALPLMAKFFDALAPQTRVILLGDPDQLASVEPGAVLGDIADAAKCGGELRGSLVTLKKNYRFGNASVIFNLCENVRAGNADRSLELLRGAATAELVASETPSPSLLAVKLRASVLEGYGDYLQARAPAEALAAFQKFRVLCAHRSGAYGVEQLNRYVESILRLAGLLGSGGTFYKGKPVLITRNDYQLRLFNGDIGIVMDDPADGSLCAWFSGRDETPRRVPLSRLPEHEPAFAMTVHKSQGSEFGSTLLILPDKASPVLTRELVYTGLTRARLGVEIWFRDEVLRSAIERRQMRSSGLREKLISDE